MSNSSPFLVDYYESSDVTEDLLALTRNNPTLATERRKMIVEGLNANFAALNVIPSERDARDQLRFASGESSPREMAWLLRLYAYSIRARANEAR